MSARFLVDSQHHRNGTAFVAIPCGEREFVAICELRTRAINNSVLPDAETAALLEVDARAAFKELYLLGVFPLPLTRLFVAVRKSIEEEVEIDDDSGKDSAQPKVNHEGENASHSEAEGSSDSGTGKSTKRTRLERRTVVDVFDGVNCIAVPFSHSKRVVKSTLRARLRNIVVDHGIALDAVFQSCGMTASCGSMASFCVSAAGSLNIWDNSSQGHLLAFGENISSTQPNANASHFMSASQLVAAGDVVRMHALVKSAIEAIRRNENSTDASSSQSPSSSLVSSRLSFVFGSTVGEGLSRPAVETSASLNSSNQATVSLERANPFSLVYIDAPQQTASRSAEISMRVAHHLGMLVSHVLAVPPPSLELTALPRSMVAIPQTLIPIVVPRDDTAARRRVHELLCLPRFQRILNEPRALLCSLSDRCPQTLAEAVMRGREIVAGRANSPHDDKGTSFRPPIRIVNRPEASEELNRDKSNLNDGNIKNDEVNIATLRLVKSIPKSETYLAADAFDYYHYRVDGFNDEGWGCAYRSLQTVLSWLHLRGVMSPSAPIPAIREIQGILALADPDKVKRAREFVGSSEWIGTYEAMLVLQHFCPDLECALLRVESGADLETSSSVQRQISDHFARGGCPIIIGGSQYAHVIAGINANVRSGNAQYLIVDPHNKEANAARAVQRGFVGWKEVEKVFDAKSWYNVCIPKVYDIDLS